MPASLEYGQLLRTVAALRSTGLVWDANSYEETIGDGLHAIDFRERRYEDVPLELRNFYNTVRDAWNGVAELDEFIGRDLQRRYTIKFIDSAIACFQCTFRDGILIKQRVSYQQSPFFRSYAGEDTYECLDHIMELSLDEYWQLFAYKEPRISELVSFRCDYDPAAFKAKAHPKAHLHIGDSEDCRVSSDSPVDAKSFFSFVVAHFYGRKREEFEAILNDWNGYTRFESCIHPEELAFPFISWGRV